MAETEDVQVAEITPDDFTADEQASPKAESSPAEQKQPDKAEEPKEEPKAEEPEANPEEPPETETEDKPKVAETETDKPDGEKPLNPKSENRYRNLANENRSLREQVEQLTSQVYQPQTTEELAQETNPETGEKYTTAEARVMALEQKLELKDYNERITTSQNTLANESFQVLNDFPIFNSNSDQYDGELASEAAALMEANLIRDPNVPETGPDGKETGKGLIIGSNVSPYQLYKTLARASGISAAKAQIKGQEATEKMLANADTAGSAAPPKEKADPLKALWADPL